MQCEGGINRMIKKSIRSINSRAAKTKERKEAHDSLGLRGMVADQEIY